MKLLINDIHHYKASSSAHFNILLFVIWIDLSHQYVFNAYLFYLNKATLEHIATKYEFSETGIGVLVALGISIPELTTNLLSCFSF